MRVVQGDIQEQQADCLIVDHFEGASGVSGAAEWVDKALEGALLALLASGDFTGKLGKSALLYTNGKLPAARVLVVGLGPMEKYDARAVRSASASAARAVRKLKGVRSVASVVPGVGHGSLDVGLCARCFAEATVMAAYQPPNYKRERPEAPVDEWSVVEFHGERLAAIERGVQEGVIVGMAVRTARDLSNEPPNVLFPAEMARRATAMATETGLTCTVLGETEMAAEAMGILLAVSRGSAHEAQLILLEHCPPGNEGQAPLVFVGKGVTFDTGGISIKPSERMEEMKHDMSGAAAVIGAMEAVARLGVQRRILGVTPVVENMPDGNAFRPGDVLTGITGKSTEILSTDAEGRLILADALGYVARYQPAAVVDLATLTGAIGIALGPYAAGLFYNEAWLREEMLAASERSGDRLWPMPLFDEYMEAIKGDLAEVKNSGGRSGGVGTSAKFLEHFTEGYPWAHLDIASVAWSTADKEPIHPKGASGFGVRVLVELASHFVGAPNREGKVNA